ncbi:MAG: metallophosphoesterase [Delftia acidovorans]|jgi:3',5'-cyclic AMP phosphodiesterase CpdA|nr:metallophosphoesterase [Delftia acidovorans]
MALLMHMSDLHFGAHDPAVCAAVARLAARLPVALLVVSGDLTQRATAAQFAQARDFLDALPVPRRLVVPGNHDLPLMAWWERLGGHAHDRYARWINAELQPWCAEQGFCVIGVDTTRWWRHQRGSLSAGQIRQVAQRLAQASPGDWRIVVSHHPLAAAHAQDRSHRPHRAATALAAWRDAGAQLVLSGHGHDPGLVQPVPGLWAAQAGTAVSLRLRAHAPNSLFTLEQQEGPTGQGQDLAWRRQLTRWDYSRQADEFLPVQRHVLDPSPQALAR